MTLKLINQKVKELKILILDFVKEVIEPIYWEEFNDSLDPAENGNYLILDHDLPTIRDLKAFLNILTALEHATQRFIDSYALIVVATVTKLQLFEDIIQFYKNFKIVMSTTSVLAHYLEDLSKMTFHVLLPELIKKITELSQLLTNENLEKAMDFFIDQLIVLEQYKENYEKSLTQKDTPPIEIKQEKKEDDSITLLIKKNDSLLKNYYKKDYESIFRPDAKTQDNSIIDYYPENKQDQNFNKNLKLLLNMVISIKKMVDGYSEYQTSSMIWSVRCGAIFIKDLSQLYSSFKQFDYKAVWAQAAGPLADIIKDQIKELNDLFEQLACIADKFECEFRLKEGLLLNLVKKLMLRHNQITYELRIPTNYLKQKNIYYKARLLAREQCLTDIDTQLSELKTILQYTNDALTDIPYPVLIKMQAYINKYYDELCMDHDNLNQYKEYLTDTLETKRGWKEFLMSQIEYYANILNLTIHSEVMTTLHKRMLYLENQKIFLNKRFDNSIKYLKDNPWYHIKLSEFKELGQQQTILNVIKKHINTLNAEKENLQPKPPTTEIRTESTDQNTKILDEKKSSEKTKAPEPKPRIANLIKLKTKELNLFSSALQKYEENKSLQPLLETLDNAKKAIETSDKLRLQKAQATLTPESPDSKEIKSTPTSEIPTLSSEASDNIKCLTSQSLILLHEIKETADLETAAPKLG